MIGVDLLPERLELARHFGAQHTLLVGDPDLDAKVEAICGPDGPGYAIDATRVAPGFELALRLVGTGGRVGTLGLPGPANLRALVAKQLSRSMASRVASRRPRRSSGSSPRASSD